MSANTGWTVTKQQTLITHPRVRFAKCSLEHTTGATLTDFYTYALKNFIQVVGITADGKLVLVREDRKVGGWSVEAIAGDIEEGETPEQAAARELNEETEFCARQIVSLGPIVPDTNRGRSMSPDSKCWTGHLCVGLDLVKSSSHHAESEIIETIEVPFPDALDCALHPPKPLPIIGLPILSNGTQNLIQKIRLTADLYELTRKGT